MGDKPTAQPRIAGPSAEFGPKFSPDNRWIAYVSDESGRREPYIQRYPKGNRLAVSIGGGASPVWAPDGREIFFAGTYDGTLRLMVVSVTRDGDSLRLGTPRPLLDMRVAGPTGISEQYVPAIQP
jgi:Tol biopolymer transport system component